MVYRCGGGTNNALDRAYLRYPIPDRLMDSTTITRSDTLGRGVGNIL